MPRILLLEDDLNLREVLADNLEDAGHAVTAVGTVAAATTALANHDFELLILDLMLPDGDGYGLCRRYRAGGGQGAVLMLTARSLEDDAVQGFAAGADDYVAKPYRLRELMARVSALLRRTRAAPPGERLGRFAVDRVAMRLTDPAGVELPLTRTEYALLVFLIDHPQQALDRDRILDAVWGEGVVVDPRTVDNFVYNLKKKLAWTPEDPWRITTVRGVGYRFEPC